ncbi:MAG: hypothetical protein ACKVS6_00190 [Planctomycetota bacterium]
MATRIATADDPAITLAVVTPEILGRRENKYTEEDRLLAEAALAIREIGIDLLPASAFYESLRSSDRLESNNIIKELEFARAARRANANRILIIDQTDYTGFSVLLYTRRSLTARVRVFDVDALLAFASNADPMTTLPVGGAPLIQPIFETVQSVNEDEGPGQDMELVLATVFQLFRETDFDARARIYQAFGRKLAEHVTTVIYPNRDKSAAPPPLLSSAKILDINTPNAAYGASDEIVIEARGSSNARVEAILPGYSEPFLLHQLPDRPGVYRGILQIPAGLGRARGPVCVRIRDSQYRYRAAWTPEEIDIDAPGLGANSDYLIKAATASGMQQMGARANSAVYHKYSGNAVPVEGPASQPRQAP